MSSSRFWAVDKPNSHGLPQRVAVGHVDRRVASDCDGVIGGGGGSSRDLFRRQIVAGVGEL